VPFKESQAIPATQVLSGTALRRKAIEGRSDELSCRAVRA